LKKSKILFLTVGVVIIGLLVLLGSTIFSTEISNYFNRTEFDSEEWKNWEESENEPSLRWNMVNDLRKKHELIGMNTKEVIELLGEPNSLNKKYMSYHLGMSGHMIDTGTLFLELENGIVVKIKLWHG